MAAAISASKSVDARLERIEATIETGNAAQAMVRQHAQEDRDRMQQDIDELKAGHKSLHEKVDQGFADIKNMIAADRERTAIDRERVAAGRGAWALARWAAGVMVGLSSAIGTALLYWLAHGRK